MKSPTDSPLSSLLDPNRIDWKLGRYGVASAAALHRPEPWQRAQEYRRVAAARMQPLEPKELRRRLPAGDYHVSRKVDGEFTVLGFTDGQAFTVNPGGTVRLGLPLLDEAAARLHAAGIGSALVAGELYVRRADGGRERVQDVSRVARRPEGPADLDSLYFAAFDLLELDGQPPPARFADSFARLTALFAGGQRVHPVDAVAASVRSPDEIERLFAQWVDRDGSEGLVLRSDVAGRFKLKPRHSLDVAVIGYSETEASDGPQRRSQLHDLLVAVLRPDGSFQVLGHVSSGLSDAERHELLAELAPLRVKSDYVEPSDQHVAYQMVRPELVIELSCLDLLTHNSRGVAVERMALHFDSPAGRYRPLRRLPLASLISPVFLRRRDDKRVDEADVRIAQLTALVDIASTDLDPQKQVSPKSQLLRREVYTKTLAGQTLVRKLVLWQTHKQEGGDFPAYVVHLTDFSPARTDPLKRELRVSNSQAQIESLWTDLHKDAIVRGWTRT